MNRKLGLLFVIAFLGIANIDLAAQETPSESVAKIRVGTFDSRLVAIAYTRSEMFEEHLSKMQAEMAKAKEQNNDSLVKQLEADAKQLQHRRHMQGFSTWPVNDILKSIKTQIGEISKQTKVDLIVSKWDVAYQGAEARTVDVTDQLVALFKPDQETRKVLESIRRKPPMPINQFRAER